MGYRPAPAGEWFQHALQAYSPLVTANTVVFTNRLGVIVVVRRTDDVPLAWGKYSDALNAPAAAADDIVVTTEGGQLLVFDTRKSD